MPKNKPQFMITYQCGQCGMDFAIGELQKPKCFYCEATENHTVIKKQKLTPEVMAERLKLVTDRMMENLKKAYEVKPDDMDEEELLETMGKAKDLRDRVQKMKFKEPEE